MASVFDFVVEVYRNGITTLTNALKHNVNERPFIVILFIGSALLMIILRAQRSKKKFRVKGSTSPGFEDVRKAFQDILDYGWEQGGSFSVYHKGKQVVNLWGGYADPEADSEWREDTLGRFFSSTKAVSAICLAMIADKGLIDYGEKVSVYWPEFGQNGKEGITVKQLVSHQAGLPMISKPHYMQWHRDDYPRLRSALEEQEPLWPPGSCFGYHVYTHAMYIDELMRRVDPKQRSLKQFFKEEIADVYGIDFYIGLPLPEVFRVSRLGVSPTGFWIPFAHLKFLWHQVFGKSYLKKMLLNIKDTTIATVSDNEKLFHRPYFLNAGIGSSHGCGTADALAKFYSIVMTGRDGKKSILSQSMLKALQQPVVSGKDEVLGFSWSWGLGTCLFKIKENNKQHLAFGSVGHGGQIGFADTKHQLGIAFVTRCLSPYDAADRRHMHLLKAVYQCIFKNDSKSLIKMEFIVTE